MIVTSLTLLLIAQPDLLTVQAAAGLLFPAATWAAFYSWRAMNDSAKPIVKASADITLSLLLGANLVLMLAWGANLLNMPAAEVSLRRGAAQRAGSIIDLPVAVGRHLRRLGTRRILNSGHIGLLAIALIGLIAPAAVAAAIGPAAAV